MKQQSFIFWKELTREYVPGKDALVLSKREKKRLDAFLASLKPDVMMVVLSDEPVEGKQHMAYVKEHYKDRKSTRLNSSHRSLSRMPSSA